MFWCQHENAGSPGPRITNHAAADGRLIIQRDVAEEACVRLCIDLEVRIYHGIIVVHASHGSPA
jgi:hypothetical protein